MKTLVLIDSNAIVHRAYHALPKNLSNSKGERTNVVYGFALALIRILEELHPDFIIAAFDLPGPTFRHLEYKEYKATRVKADKELYDQIPRVREMLDTFGIPIYAVEGFEADDILGTLVEQCKDEDLMVYIASGDRDVYQLLNGQVKVLMLKKGFSEAEIFDHDHLKEVYNLEPSDFIDLKALAGDASDNIPGVPGIGPKTATEIILKFDTLENLYEQIAKLLNPPAGRAGCSIVDLPHSVIPAPSPVILGLDPRIHQSDAQGIGSPGHGAMAKTPRCLPEDDKMGENDDKEIGVDDKLIREIAKELAIKERILKLLIEYKDQAFQSQRLATIRRDVPIECDLEKARWGQYDKEGLRKLFEELDFKSLLRRFAKNWEEKSESVRGRPVSTRQSIRGGESESKVTEEQKKKDEQLRLEL